VGVCVRYRSCILDEQELADRTPCFHPLILTRTDNGSLVADPFSSNASNSVCKIGATIVKRNVSEHRCMENDECGVTRSVSYHGCKVNAQVPARDVWRAGHTHGPQRETTLWQPWDSYQGIASAMPSRRTYRLPFRGCASQELESAGGFRRPAPAVWGNGSVGFCGLEPGDLQLVRTSSMSAFFHLELSISVTAVTVLYDHISTRA
jgi:hypothetical protein